MGKHISFGSLGQHEVYLPTTGNGNKKRRNRKNCRFYNPENLMCYKIQDKCVGPTLCKKYEGKHIPQKKKWDVGTVVFSKHRGLGKIAAIDKNICTIKFSNGAKVNAKYPDAFKNGTFTLAKTDNND